MTCHPMNQANATTSTFPPSKRWLRWKGIELRLGLALAILSMTTLLLALFSTFTFNRLDQALVELKEKDIPALEQAARLNDMVRLVITDSSILTEADSNLERRQAIQSIESNIQQMTEIMGSFPEYYAYFKDIIAQVSNSLSLLYQSGEESRQLNQELRNLLEGFYPLLQQVSDELDLLPSEQKEKIQYSQLKALLYYQLGLVEKLYNIG